MNKLRKFCKEQPSVASLATLILFVLILGSFLSIVVLVVTTWRSGIYLSPLCFSNGCVKDYFSKIDQSLAIFKAVMDLGVSIATIGGIFVALLSYFSTSSNAALANHIEHMKVFCEYLESEVKKRDRLSSQHIDALLLYGKIFNQSRSGKTTVSDDYRVFSERLNSIIDESNSRSVVGAPGGFSYKEHQRQVKEHLMGAGIVVYMAPRNDYFEMEEQLFSLLHRIGQSFCPPGVLPDLVERNYR
jgi:hypothetical protein